VSNRSPVVLFRDDFGDNLFQFTALGLTATQVKKLTQRQNTPTAAATTKPAPGQADHPDAGAKPPSETILKHIAGLVAAWFRLPAQSVLMGQPPTQLGINQVQQEGYEPGHSFPVKQLLGLDQQLIEREPIFG
jgi:hypothetical protein